LYGAKIGLSLRGKDTLRASENRVLRGIFGPRSEEVTGGRENLYSEDGHDMLS
jgi:hypothetical protein